MKLESLSIENFRSIEDKLEISFSDTKTVFVGKNNSGKTNIFKALEILLGGRYPSYTNLGDKDFFDLNKEIKIKLTISEINEDDLNKLNFYTRSSSRDKERIKISGGKLNLIFKADKFEGDIVQNFTITTDKNLKNTKAGFQSTSDNFRKSLCSFIFVPADRNIEVNLKTSEYTWCGKLLKLILDNQAETEEYKELINDLTKIEQKFKKLINSDSVLQISQLLTYIEDLKFSLTKSQEPKDLLKSIEILVKSDKRIDYIDISRMGHGTQSAIMLALFHLYLETFSDNNKSLLKVFVIDEPENFLHPQGKRLINSLLNRIAEKYVTQIIYATHSAGLASNFDDKFTLQDIKYTYKDDLNSTKIKEFSEKVSNKFLKIQEDLNAENGEIFFASKVLLVDGQTEKYSIPNIFKFNDWQEEDLPEVKKSEIINFDLEHKSLFIKRYFDLDHNNISIINVGGKGNIYKYYEFACSLMGKDNVWIMFDRDSDFEKTDKSKILSSIEEVWGSTVTDEDFMTYHWLILDAEFENYYNLESIANFLKIKKEEIENFISSQGQKSSKYSKNIEAFIQKKLGKEYTKPTFAYRLSKYLTQNNGYKRELTNLLKEII